VLLLGWAKAEVEVIPEYKETNGAFEAAGVGLCFK
jgi:hypothetical protein